MKVCPRCQLTYPSENEACFVDGNTLVEMSDPYLGMVVRGRYKLERVLGEGGMATVYYASHTLVDQAFAVKILRKELAAQPTTLERFRREAKNTAQLEHPNIVEIIEHGTLEDGGAFLVMELLNGATLNDVLGDGALHSATVANFGFQAALGLARAHDFGVIHRDLKPENIFITEPEQGQYVVKLLDFGIGRSNQDARLTNAGELFGTPQYMAPERVTNIDAGASSDLYALGCILFEMVTGRLPFQASDVTSFFLKHMRDAPPRPKQFAPTCPDILEDLILKLMEKDPEDRPVDAHHVCRVLSQLIPTQSQQHRALPAAPEVHEPLAATSLEHWNHRVVTFERMIERLPEPQPALAATLDEIRAQMASIEDLRRLALVEQRKLEVLERNARESRSRLGNAVQVLAEDLSRAKEDARSAETSVQPYMDADRTAEAGYREAHDQLMRIGGYRELGAPDGNFVSALRSVVTSLERWLLTEQAAERAQHMTENMRRDVTDLHYQVQALRGQLARAETELEIRRVESERLIHESGAVARQRESELIRLASSLTEGLRPFGMRDLFAELD